MSYVAPFVIAGIGVSMALPSLPAASLNAVPHENLGQAPGIVNTLQGLGTDVAIAVVTAVFDANGSLTSPSATTAGPRRSALLVAAAFSVAGALTVLGCASRPLRVRQ